ncbi:gag/pol protein [Cucumis melo var. makuwa]|uniref:Gag/pol protein n=1 Tax=Cucumis melo var. makuwa TaxID=1194695 RepID=A0A5D3CK74_CUCMM|nr:gag/pol protein [Cucumis melo var. makuwa]TYK10609.1 gag/pol protein [Cucumis melo var. makuwa]
MDSLKGMFGQPEWSLRHEAIKYIYTKRMKEGASAKEHVLDMMMHFNIAEVNEGAINEANQETSSLKRLSDAEITFKVRTGEMVSAKAVGDLNGRVIRQLDHYLGLSEAQFIIPDDGIEDPLTFKQAMNDVDSYQWIKAMDLEMESMYSNSIWTLVDQPNDNVDEPCVYKRIISSTVAFLVLYVDDILLIGNDVVGIVSRYQSNPGRDHWTAVKNILKYLKRTKDYMLVYGSKDLILTGYTDSDFQTDKDARKSTSGSVFTLNGGAVV